MPKKVCLLSSLIECVALPVLLGLHISCAGSETREAEEPPDSAAGSAPRTPDEGALENSPPRSGAEPALQDFRGRYPVGFSEMHLPADDAGRPGLVSLWYPAQTGTREKHYPYLLASGHVAVDAPPRELSNADEKLSVVVLSHGAGGSATDLAWLSETLASRGFLVVGVEHYGESRRYGLHTADERAPLFFWRRPNDVHRGLAHVLDESEWARRVAADRLYGVGHSAGGHTLLAAAGLAYTPARLADYCATAPSEDLGCRYPKVYGPPPEPPQQTLRHRSLSFDGLVLLEPALTQSFAPETLEKATVATLLVAGRPGNFLPFEEHALYVANHLAPETSLFLPGASHFSFLGQCTMELSVFDVPLCESTEQPKSKDDGLSKKDVHRRVMKELLRFLSP